MDTGLGGWRVLITGASGGIGQAVARAFDAEGAQVVLHCHRRRAAAQALASALRRAEVVQADLRVEPAVEAMYAAIAGDRRLDAVVVNAGVWNEAAVPLHEMSVAQWEETMSSDLRSAFLTCRGFLRHLAAAPRDEAAIVLVASTAGLFGEAGHADYACAKAAMAHGLTATLKNEIVRLAPRGRVNCVCPGWTRTPMAEPAVADPRLVARVTATMALRKIAEPEDVARAAVYLASPRLAGHVSGAILPVAGGMEGRLLHE